MSIRDTLKKAWETKAPIRFRLKNNKGETQTSHVSRFEENQVVVRLRGAADLQVVTADEFESVEILPAASSSGFGK